MSEKLISLFRQHFRCDPAEIRTLQPHASNRKIYRLLGADGNSVIGIENSVVKENEAFCYFAKHFKQNKLPVPEIFAVSDDKLTYLEEDLGDTTLFNALDSLRTKEDPFPIVIKEYYQQIIRFLPRFQIESIAGMDFHKCFPTSSFHRDAMIWDMNYFREKFLNKVLLPYSPNILEKEFIFLADILEQVPQDYFMYRDLQSRNIMIKDNSLYFIDFQGGRRGPLHYDLASLLYQASAEIPETVRQELVNEYIHEALKYIVFDERLFHQDLSGFILLRILQVLGTYGVQGLEGRKQYFLDSIPRAVNNLVTLLPKAKELFSQLPELSSICYRLPDFIAQKGLL